MEAAAEVPKMEPVDGAEEAALLLVFRGENDAMSKDLIAHELLLNADSRVVNEQQGFRIARGGVVAKRGVRWRRRVRHRSEKYARRG